MNANRELQALMDQHRKLRDMEAYIPALVKQARIAGASWSQIGSALGTTKQAAQQRYGGVVPAAPNGDPAQLQWIFQAPGESQEA